MPKLRWTESEITYLKDHWPTKGSAAVAVVIEKDPRAVQQKAFRMGLVCDTACRNARRSKTHTENNTSSDTEYFLRNWHPNLAYIVGYIFADGSIHKNLYSLGFLCHSKDEEILLAIHKELKVKNKIHRNPARETKGRKNGPRTYFNVTSKKVVMSLIERFGLAPGKTHLDLSMPAVPDDLFGHFLRGYFDGDGHIQKIKGRNSGRMCLIGTKTFLHQMVATASRLIGSDRVCLSEQNGMHVVQWGLHDNLKNLHQLMYPAGDYIFLSRKRAAFDAVVSLSVKVAAVWTEEEIAILQKYYDRVPYRKIAKAVSKSELAVRHKLRQLGLSSNNRKLRRHSVDIEPIST